MAERQLAKKLIYSQRAMRLAQGINVDQLQAVTSAQSAPVQAAESCTMTVRQKMKQFDAVRREHWQQQLQV